MNTMCREYSITKTMSGFVSIEVLDWELECDMCYLIHALIIETIGL
jgi:hypothetical protein